MPKVSAFGPEEPSPFHENDNLIEEMKFLDPQRTEHLTQLREEHLDKNRKHLTRAIKESQQCIRKILRAADHGAFDLLLGKVTAYASCGTDGKFYTSFSFSNIAWITADEIVFTFIALLEQSDHARCAHCGKLFLGTMGGHKKFCSSSCRVSRHQMDKRKQKKQTKMRRGEKNERSCKREN